MSVPSSHTLRQQVELHAHLHGSARTKTISELAPAGVDTKALQVTRGRSLEACFEIFGIIHQTVTTRASVARIAKEVLEDFAGENVKYLELRTTPRRLSDADVEGYILTVVVMFRVMVIIRQPWQRMAAVVVMIKTSVGDARWRRRVRCGMVVMWWWWWVRGGSPRLEPTPASQVLDAFRAFDEAQASSRSWPMTARLILSVRVSHLNPRAAEYPWLEKFEPLRAVG